MLHHKLSFIAQRQLFPTDEEAALAAGVEVEDVHKWLEEDPDFAQQLQDTFHTHIKIAQQRAQANLAAATDILQEGLQAMRPNGIKSMVPDWTNRLKAAEMIFRMAGIDKGKDESTTPNAIVMDA